jgi:hypothetical protein
VGETIQHLSTLIPARITEQNGVREEINFPLPKGPVTMWNATVKLGSQHEASGVFFYSSRNFLSFVLGAY